MLSQMFIKIPNLPSRIALYATILLYTIALHGIYVVVIIQYRHFNKFMKTVKRHSSSACMLKVFITLNRIQ